DSVMYFDLYVPSGDVDKEGKPIPKSISSRIEGLKGVLLIDATSNKSGKEEIAIFPSIQSKAPSYVYYDDKTIQNAVYTRDSFYYELDKFSFNSLDNFAKSDITFKGQLVSAKIFPNIREPLVLMPADESLGFLHQTPNDGYDNYLQKGKFKGQISLSNIGLQAKGRVSYLGANIDSEDIIYRPKQMTCSAKRFDLKEDRTSAIQVPKVSGIDVSIDWRPYNDSMYISSKEAPFQLFQAGLHTLKGRLILTPSGLKGQGLLDWDKGSMTSNLFSFGAFSVYADTMDLKIRALGGEELAFDTRNINGKADFDELKGNFKANTDEISTIMPNNKYKTSMNEFDWDMKAQTITFKADPTKLASFVSIHPDQDSLTFKGKDAFYDLKTNLLKIDGVPSIFSADALIYPDNGKVEIQSGGVMTTLTNARIVADTLSKYHVINRATVNVKGRRVYEASGFYEYNIADKTQEIEFSSIIGQPVGKGQYSEKKEVTRANGIIGDATPFFIDDKTTYKGNVALSADAQNLTFQGFAKLDLNPNITSNDWFTINCPIDRKDVVISYDSPKNDNGDPLEVGVFLSKETADIYPRLLMPLYIRKDRPIISAKGFIKYNKSKDQFAFGDSTKVIANTKYGNSVLYDIRNNDIVAEGDVNLCSAMSIVQLKTAGRIKTKYAELPDPQATPTENNGDTPQDSVIVDKKPAFQMPKLDLDVVSAINLPLPAKVMDLMFNDILASSLDAPDIYYSKDFDLYDKALSHFVTDKDEYVKMTEGMRNASLNVPKKYNNYNFLFAGLNLKWNAEIQSFVTIQDNLPLASVKGEPVNRLLKGFIEYRMPSNEEDKFFMYLASPSGLVYFFAYQPGGFGVFSTNTAFVEAISKLKGKEKTLKDNKGNSCEIQIIEESLAQIMISRVKEARN
ncbi:MAG: hypothetical protein KA010_03825, partial [Saprospiraceae bacterium]|nr:hypothetical protein [Saprospiraceae bacterium]